MSNWTSFSALFPGELSDAISQLVSTYATDFGVFTYTQFAKRTESQIVADLQQLPDTHPFVEQLAIWLNAKATAGGLENWTQFITSFSAADQAFATQIQTQYDNLEVSFYTFQSYSTTKIAEDLVEFGLINGFWASYYQSLKARTHELDQNNWVATFPEDLQTAANTLFSDLEGASVLSTIEELAEADSKVIANTIASLTASHTWVTANTAIQRGAMAELLDQYTPDEEWEAAYRNSLSQIYEGNQALVDAAVQVVEKLIANATLTEWADFATLSATTHNNYIASLNNRSKYHHAMAQYVVGKAVSTLEWPGEQASYTTLRIPSQILNSNSNQPGANLRVRVTDISFPYAHKIISENLTDEHGVFQFSYTWDTTYGPTEPVFRFEIRDKTGNTTYTSADTNFNTATQTTLLLEFALGYPTDTRIAIGTYLTETSTTLPTELASWLAAESITYLADIRAMGGLARSTETAVQNNLNEALELDAMAQFELLGVEMPLARFAYDAGFTSMGAVAAATRTAFIDAIAEAPGSPWNQTQALLFWNAARRTDAFIRTQIMGMAGDLASGVPMRIGDELEPSLRTSASQAFGAKCDCPDCLSGVSPLAYLASLLDYAGKYVKYSGSLVSLNQLQTIFGHPYCELPANCEAANQPVCQVRVAVEVLRADLGTDIPYAKKLPYLKEAYELLLNQASVSVDDLRTLGTATDEQKGRIAKRMGISVPQLNDFYLEYAITSPTLTEENLELLFGLQSTLRHPISTGYVQNDSPTTPLIHSHLLHGVFWNRNTDADGWVYLEVDTSPSPGKVKVYKDSARTTDSLVAQGNISTLSPYTAMLYAVNDSGLTGQIEFGTVAVNNTVQISVLPRLLAWRIQNQYQTWKALDWPDRNPYFTATAQWPIIEPDWMGPDDIREALDSPTTLSAQPLALRIWETRKAFMETQRASLASNGQDVDAMLTDLTNAATYTPYGGSAVNQIPLVLANLSVNFPWPSTPGVPTDHILAVKAALSDATLADDANDTIANFYRLELEAFLRLAELAEMHQANTSSDPTFTDEEYHELLNILLNPVKKAFYAVWITEEAGSSPAITLTPDLFWNPLVDPKEESWDLTTDVSEFYATPPTLRIDPQSIALMDLPGVVYGETAVTLYQTRKNALEAIFLDIQTEIPVLNKLKTAIAGVGIAGTLPTPPPTVTSASYPLDFDDIAAELENTSNTNYGDAIEYVNQSLFLTKTEFILLNAILQQQYPSNPLSAEIIKTLDQKLILVAKRSLASTWAAAEAAAGLDAYWKVYGHKLEKWLATPENRRLWVEGLDHYSQMPVLEPDQIHPGDFFNPEDQGNANLDNPAYIQWKARRAAIDTQFSTIQANTVSNNVETVLRTTVAELEGLNDLLQTGGDITRRLQQLKLDAARLQLILKVAGTGATPSTEDTDIFHAIVLQAWKERQYGLWNLEDRDAEIVLGPDHFEIAYENSYQFSQYLAETQRPYRYNRRQRKEWQNKLESRFDQRAAMHDAYLGAVNRTEEATLRILRDALIRQVTATVLPNAPFEERADYATQRYLLDMHTQCCMETTRVAQAIETLQTLMHGLRTHQLIDAFDNFALDSDDFDNDWKWLGSYSTWRGLMFVYLYPENILLPSLRPYKTGKFAQIIDAVRNNPRLTPSTVCHWMQDYQDYLEDMHALDLQATCTTTVYFKSKDCGAKTASPRTMHFHFAKGGKSEGLYWSSYDEANPSNYSQTFWEPVPGMEKVHKAVGAFPFQTKSGERFVYVFALKPRTNEEPVLIANRFNLTTHKWQNDLEDFVNTKVSSWTWVVGERENEKTSPIFAATSYEWDAIWSLNGQTLDPSFVSGRKIKNRTLLYGKLDDTGTTWEDDFNELEIAWFENFNLLAVTQFSSAKLLFLAKYTIEGVGDFLGHIIEDQAPLKLRISAWRYISQGRLGVNVNAYFANVIIATTGLTSIYGRSLANLQITQYLNSHWEVDNHFFKDGFDEFCGLISLGDDTVEFHFKDGNRDSRVIKLEMVQSMNYTPHNILQSTNGTYQPSTINIPFFRIQAKDSITGTVYTSEPNTDHFFDPQTVLNPRPFHITHNFAGPCFKNEENQTSSIPSTLSYACDFPSNTCVMLETNTDFLRLSPVSRTIYNLTDPGSPVANRSAIIEDLFNDNAVTTTSLPYSKNPNLVYLEEAYYFLPIFLALELQKQKFFTEALDLYRLVYDYAQEKGNRKIYYGLRREETQVGVWSNAFDWLDDPSNPHTIAGTRNSSYTRFTVFSIVRCLLEYADQEYTRDTSESVPRARQTYDTALSLLRSEYYTLTDPDCADHMAGLDEYVDDAYWRPEWERLKVILRATNNHDLLHALIEGDGTYAGIEAEFTNGSLSWEERFQRLEAAMETLLEAVESAPNRLCKVVNEYHTTGTRGWVTNVVTGSNLLSVGPQVVSSASNRTLGNTLTRLIGTATPTWLNAPLSYEVETASGNPDMRTVSGSTGGMFQQWLSTQPLNLLYQSGQLSSPYIPLNNYFFCVPKNPVPDTLLLHAELNLYKIRHCRNIAGIKRQLDAYAAPTDTRSGMPLIGANGQIAFPGSQSMPPSQYRFDFLLMKARELAQMAQQMEATLLSTLEKADAEHYTLMKARQEVSLTRAGVRLNDMRIQEAENGVELAELQQKQNSFSIEQLSKFIDNGLNGWEIAMIAAYSVKAFADSLESIHTATAKVSDSQKELNTFAASNHGLAGTAQLISLAAGLTINISSIKASHERQKERWKYELGLAEIGLRIGNQQIKLANDRLRIVGQERHIANMQYEFAEATVDFLINKFTNYELYDWMSRVLEGVYAWYLQQATSMARIAQNQLAFERQQPPAGYIMDDYWYPASENVNFSGDQSERVDRKGMTGSARLMQDLTKLDLHAMETNKRKLQLTKTFSLAQLAPGEFEELRQHGAITFRTPMEWFDRDFPGHYLRLIRRVRTTVVALIPPTEGIKARLATTGISRVTVGGDTYQTVTIPRGSESVSLTSPYEATGMFDLQPMQTELLNPFEGMGVDAIWEFRMDKAANLFDYDTLADVLITFEYTALESEDYRQQVIRELDTEREGDRAFSLRYQFPDQWYDLNNVDPVPNTLDISLNIPEYWFPSQLKDTVVRQMGLMVIRKDGNQADLNTLQIGLAKVDGSVTVGGIGTLNANGVASTRTRTQAGSLYGIYSGNGIPFIPMLGKTPAGQYELSVPKEILDMIKADEIQDILLIITFQGTEPTRQ